MRSSQGKAGSVGYPVIKSPETHALLHDNPAEDKKPIPITSSIFCLFVLIGVYPYLIANGLWTKLGVFVDELPEGDSFGAFMGAFIQAANFLTFMWIFCLVLQKRVTDATTIACMIATSILNCTLIIPLWNKENDVSGESQSVALFTMSSVCGFIGSTSLMVLWSFCAEYPSTYTTAVSIGLGLGGIIPVAIDGIQSFFDSDSDTQIPIFFGCLLFINICSGLAFARVSSAYHTPYLFESYVELKQQNQISQTEIIILNKVLIMHQFWNNMLTFCIFPGFQPYLSKGPSSEIQILTWVFLMSNIIGRAISSKVNYKNPLLFNLLQSAIGSYLIVEVFLGNEARFPLVCIAVSLYSIINGYHSTLIYILCYELPLPPSHIGQASRWVAVFGQIGAIVGSAVPVAIVSAKLL